MKTNHHRIVNWTLLAAIWCAALSGARAAKPEPDAESFHPTRVLARFKAGEMAGPQNPVLRQHGLGVRHQSKMLPQVVVLDLSDRGQARTTHDEFMQEFALAARRAAEDALANRVQALAASPELRR